MSFGIPFVSSSWALRDPAYPPPAERREIVQHGRGIGDISVTSRFWIFNPDTHRDWNVAAGAGMKFPTGNARIRTGSSTASTAPKRCVMSISRCGPATADGA